MSPLLSCLDRHHPRLCIFHWAWKHPGSYLSHAFRLSYMNTASWSWSNGPRRQRWKAVDRTSSSVGSLLVLIKKCSVLGNPTKGDRNRKHTSHQEVREMMVRGATIPPSFGPVLTHAGSGETHYLYTSYWFSAILSHQCHLNLPITSHRTILSDEVLLQCDREGSR